MLQAAGLERTYDLLSQLNREVWEACHVGVQYPPSWSRKTLQPPNEPRQSLLQPVRPKDKSVARGDRSFRGPAAAASECSGRARPQLSLNGIGSDG